MIDLSKPDLWWTAGPWAVLWPEVRLLSYADVVELLRRAEPGLWREVVSWPHEEVEQDGFVVPLFAPEPERAGWRRRAWWGRHPLDDHGGEFWWRWQKPFLLVPDRPALVILSTAGLQPEWLDDDVVRRDERFVYEWPLRANDGGVVEPLLWEGDQA